MSVLICPQCNTENKTPARLCNGCGVGFFVQPKKKSNAGWVGLLLIILVVVLCNIGSVPIDKSIPPNVQQAAITNPNKPPNKASFAPTVPTPNPKGLVLVKSTWRKGGFDAIAIWKVTIKNESDKPLGDIKFRTAYFSESRNKVTSGGVDALLGKDTIQKVVPPKSSRTFEVNDGFVSDEAVTADFQIVSWQEIPK